MNLYYSFRIWWAELSGAPVDVRWFGAKGDGVTDDSDALQRAVAHASGIVVKDNGSFHSGD